MSCLVSVIVPTFNNTSEDLTRTINSVLDQTYDLLELIVVDDGSRHPFAGLRKIINDSRIKWVPVSHNCGVASARNEGIDRSTGEYIAFLDAGDWWDSLKLARQLEVLEEKNVGWVYSSTVCHTPEGQRVYSYASDEGWILDRLLKWQVVKGSASSVMVKKDILNKVGGFYTQEDIVEDWDLWIRLAKISQVGFVPEPTVHILIFANGSRGYQLRKIDRLENFINRHSADFNKAGVTNFVQAKKHLVAGRTFLFNHMAIKGIGRWLLILKYKPSLFPIQWLPIALIAFFYPTCFSKIYINSNIYKSIIKRRLATFKNGLLNIVN